MILEGKGSFFVLLIIVAVLTLTLAVLAGYLFFVAGSSKPTDEATTHKETTKEVNYEEIAVEKLFEGKKIFNLSSSSTDVNDKKISVIQVSAEIHYFKGKEAEKTKEKIEKHKGQILEVMSTYFSKMTLDDVKMPETREKVKQDLKKIMNDIINKGVEEKEKSEIIHEVVFEEWFYQ